MQHRRIWKRGVAGGALALAATAALTLPEAQAAPAPPGRPGQDGLSAAAAGELAAQLGSAAQGVYYDAGRRRLVVNVVSERDADLVRAKGAEPRRVAYSLAELRGAADDLKARASVPGTAWSVDPRADRLVVSADRTVTGQDLARVRSVVADQGDRAVLRRTEGRFTPYLSGGQAIWGSDARCSLGFNVRKGGASYFLTAGHCGKAVSNWAARQGGSNVARTEQSSFPGHDYALVRYTDTSTAHPSAVDLYDGTSQQITQAGSAVVGQRVRRSGSTTHVHGGSVTGLDATVNYREGTVEGLVKTDVCAEAGDSGGALFDGSTALGLTSGGSGNCQAGGETYFQPVPEALAAYGASID
ncbi:S1 family peptidase [Streptomyces sp. NPDC058045]|uniref:S1 family peptidase n=1 Tax=Streptomyces sp. NPDC058045 TaxID=3346311 RepID=UPI0036E5C651